MDVGGTAQSESRVEPEDGKGTSAKKLGLWMCIALVVGNMIGSGIFLLPAALADYGAISIAGWIVTSAGAIVLALIFGRLARLVSKTGGPSIRFGRYQYECLGQALAEFFRIWQGLFIEPAVLWGGIKTRIVGAENFFYNYFQPIQVGLGDERSKQAPSVLT